MSALAQVLMASYGGAGGGGGGGAGWAAARYWRMAGIVTGDYLEISHIAFAAAGVAQSGTLTASHAPTGGSMAGLTDASLSTRAYWPDSIVEGGSFWIAFEFTSAVLINGFLQGGYDTSGRHVQSWYLQRSEDGTSWATVASASGISYPGNYTLSSVISFA